MVELYFLTKLIQFCHGVYHVPLMVMEGLGMTLVIYCPIIIIDCPRSRDGRFGSKVGQIGPKWDKSGAFSDQISVHLAREAKCTEI